MPHTFQIKLTPYVVFTCWLSARRSRPPCRPDTTFSLAHFFSYTVQPSTHHLISISIFEASLCFQLALARRMSGRNMGTLKYYIISVSLQQQQKLSVRPFVSLWNVREIYVDAVGLRHTFSQPVEMKQQLSTARLKQSSECAQCSNKKLLRRTEKKCVCWENTEGKNEN
jgi:hypothetical protein